MDALDLQLPDDLTGFLRTGLQLRYDHRIARCGRVTVLGLEELRLDSFEVRSRGKEVAWRDPNRGRRGSYHVPGVNVVRISDNPFANEGLLIWLPGRRGFATWDREQADIWVFRGTGWRDIEVSPLVYLNALWDPRAVELEWFVPWPYNRFEPDDDLSAGIRR